MICPVTGLSGLSRSSPLEHLIGRPNCPISDDLEKMWNDLQLLRNLHYQFSPVQSSPVQFQSNKPWISPVTTLQLKLVAIFVPVRQSLGRYSSNEFLLALVEYILL